MSSPAASVKFSSGLTASDPEQQPVLFIGLAEHLAALSWNDVRCKLEPRVTQEVWQRGIAVVSAAPGEQCELWPRGAWLAALPARRSRHAAPSRAHAIAKTLRAHQRSGDETVVLVCRKRDVYASALSAARSYPLYTAKTGPSPLAAAAAGAGASGPVGAGGSRTVSVELLLAAEETNEGASVESLPAHLRSGALTPADLSTLQAAGDAARRAARIADTPPCDMNVSAFIEEAVQVAKELELPPPVVLRGAALRALGGLRGVGAGASDPPALVALSYAPPGGERAGGVAWVGKGIVYDTGGLSIKPRTGMVGMKGDCAGAAGVLGAFAAAVRARPRVPLHAVLCLAENAVGPDATRPDDIHTLLSGRTVEINNTDAEGRLVLADGVVWAARELRAEVIVDVATLTGAQGVATGKYHAALLSNSARLEAGAVAAGAAAGELTHALPFAPELHFTEFASPVADMKNSVADRGNAQPSCAGLFILAHLGFDTRVRWLHVDMAAPAHVGERATGYGVGLLSVLIGAHTESPLLQALSPGPLLE